MDAEAEREGGISQEQPEYVDLPDFTDFDKYKEEYCFEADQIWSVYDTLDSMPRFYAHIRKVYYSSGTFRLLITGLEPEPENSMERIWVKQGLPVACGKFVHGETEEINNRFIFSHLIAYKIDNPSNFSYVIYPKKGEIWAIYQDWDINKWSFHPKGHMKFKFDIVEVLSDFDKESGPVVAYMEKVEGFVSLFQRTSSEFRVLSSELFMFSHRIPSSKMTGNERADVPVGTHELDTASLPADLDQYYFSNNGDHQPGQPTQSGYAGKQNMNPGSKTSRPVSSQQEVVGRKGNAKVRPQRDEPSFSQCPRNGDAKVCDGERSKMAENCNIRTKGGKDTAANNETGGNSSVECDFNCESVESQKRCRNRAHVSNSEGAVNDFSPGKKSRSSMLSSDKDHYPGEETAIDIGVQQSAQLPHSGHAGVQNLNLGSIMDQPASFQQDKAKCKGPAKPAVQKPQNHQGNQNSHAGMQFGAPKLEMEKKRANTWNNFTKAKKEKFTFEERLKMWKKMDAAEKKEYA